MNKKSISSVLFFGSLWGAAEAVLGYLLHFIPANISGFIMFPVGYCFMYCAYKKTGDIKSVFFTGIVAAAIKLINLAMPFLPVMKTIVPVACIVFESLAVFWAYKIFSSSQSKSCAGVAVFSSLSWRVMYLCLQFFLSLFGAASIFTDGTAYIILNFVIIQGLANAALLILLLKLDNAPGRLKLLNGNINGYTSLRALAVSAALTVFCSLLRLAG